MKIIKICILMLMKVMMIMRVDQLRVPLSVCSELHWWECQACERWTYCKEIFKLIYVNSALDSRGKRHWQQCLLPWTSGSSELRPRFTGRKALTAAVPSALDLGLLGRPPLIHRAKGTDSSSAFPFITSKDINGWHYLTWICLLSYVKEVQVFQLSWVKVLQNNIALVRNFRKKSLSKQKVACMMQKLENVIPIGFVASGIDCKIMRIAWVHNNTELPVVTHFGRDHLQE
jgi:hypothetical protein